MQASGTGRRQGSDADPAVAVQTPQGIATGRQVSQLHLRMDKNGLARLDQQVETGELTSGGRETEEGRSSPS